MRRLLPNVKGLTGMDLITANRSCVPTSLGAFLSATQAIWSNKEKKSICAVYCSLPLPGHFDPPATTPSQPLNVVV